MVYKCTAHSCYVISLAINKINSLIVQKQISLYFDISVFQDAGLFLSKL